MTLQEARNELEKFVKLKTTMRPQFVDVLLEATRVFVSDGEYILKFEDNIANRVTEWVPLVRCRECRHRPLMVDGDVKDPNYNESALNEDYTCPYLCYEDEFYNCMPPDDGFCSCGEKMDEVRDETKL